MELKPNLTGTVEADLPEDSFIKSNEVAKKLSPMYNSSTKWKHENGGSKIAEALKEMNNNKMQMEITKKRLDILEKQEKKRKRKKNKIKRN